MNFNMEQVPSFAIGDTVRFKHIIKQSPCFVVIIYDKRSGNKGLLELGLGKKPLYNHNKRFKPLPFEIERLKNCRALLLEKT